MVCVLVKILSHANGKRAKRPKGLKFRTFMGRFQISLNLTMPFSDIFILVFPARTRLVGRCLLFYVAPLRSKVIQHTHVVQIICETSPLQAVPLTVIVCGCLCVGVCWHLNDVEVKKKKKKVSCR